MREGRQGEGNRIHWARKGILVGVERTMQGWGWGRVEGITKLGGP